jgi:hypothetical protein
MPSSYTGGRFEAWLDESGDLFLDRSHVGLLAAALPAHLTPKYIASIEEAHRGSCAAVLDAAEQAACSVEALDETRIRSCLHSLGIRIAELMPYGILSKFVPDLLLRPLAAAGDDGPAPFPSPSPGAI